jgi:AcrR family transcriptional regulator
VAVEARDPNHTSTRIEDASLALFFERGFKSTTMREIAVACGITAGALYNHFPSKDQLLFSIMLRVHEGLEADLLAALDGAGTDPRDRLRAVVRAHALMHTQSRIEARVANQEINSLPDPERGLIVAIRKRMRRMFMDVLEDGQRRGAFDLVDVSVTTSAILNMGIRIAEWFRPDGPLSAEEVSGMHADLAIRMVGAQE